MALVKMVRNEPRVAGGKKEGMFDETLVADLKKLGWKPADKGDEKVETRKEEPKAAPVKEESKVEPVKEEPKAEEKKEDKVEKPAKK